MPSPLRSRVVETLADTDRDAWDRVAGDAFYQSHGWLAGLERDLDADASYVVVELDDRVAGAISVYRVRREQSHAYKRERFRATLGVDGEALFAGALRGYRTVFAVDRGLNPRDRASVVQALVSGVHELALAQGARTVIWPFLTADAARALSKTATATLGFETVEAVLAVPAGGISSYVAGLSRHHRANVRREIRAFEGAGWSIEIGRLGSRIHELAVLAANVQARYGSSATADGLQRRLSSQAAFLDDQSVVFCCSDRQGLVGAALWYEWGDTLYVRLVGFDYGRLRRSYEYFNLAYYLPLEHGAGRVERLHLGIEAWEAKLLRGARLLPLWSAATKADGDLAGACVCRDAGYDLWLGRLADRGISPDSAWFAVP